MRVKGWIKYHLDHRGDGCQSILGIDTPIGWFPPQGRMTRNDHVLTLAHINTYVYIEIYTHLYTYKEDTT